MKHLDLFTGIGGFSLAAQRTGWDTVAHSEIDPHATACLERRFPDVPNLGDVTEVEGNTDVDIITAGSPCQDYSVAGRRAGTAGVRSGLIAHTFRLVDECKAEWVVIENVPGLLSSNGGRDLGAVLGTLGDLGMGFAWRVLDAQAFGVPQRRRRLFIVGRARGSFVGPSKVLFVGEGLPGDTPKSEEARTQTAAGDAGGAGAASVVHTTQDPIISHDRTHCLSIDATVGVLAHDRVRKLTPTECERLQGYPDGWTEGSSDTQRYRQLGNSVAVPVVQWVSDRINQTQGA